MKSKVVIAPTNKKALDAIKKVQEQKKKLQKMMAQGKSLKKILSQA